MQLAVDGIVLQTADVMAALQQDMLTHTVQLRDEKVCADACKCGVRV